MNKLMLVLVIAAFFSACTEKETKNNLEITGTVKGLKKGKLYIQRVIDSNLIAIDTIILNGNSSFESNIKLDSPEMLYLFLDRGVSNSVDNNLLFFAEPGKINIDTDLESFLGKSKVTGSKNHDLYQGYKKIISQFNNQQLELMRDEIMAKKDNKDISAEINQKNDAILKRKYLYSANYALTNANYEVAPYIALTDIYDINMRYLDTINKSMSAKVAKSKYGKKLAEYITKRKKEEEIKN
jgi:Domain of unknown function (DUF4369)